MTTHFTDLSVGSGDLSVTSPWAPVTSLHPSGGPGRSPGPRLGAHVASARLPLRKTQSSARHITGCTVNVGR
ncbi:hypothetical protein EYF80_060541 [Liparis tanakae]|uniref:Uncharacterized protein n=1 Tax=Liparis tanakae TaxID=230148 RepID=A0A4Z2EL75_9TELE|nr:hypothetical protein EYF80_060541 [Liparis tanakae]